MPEAASEADARAWLRKAALDLLAAEHEMGHPGGGLWSDVTFHAQRAAEKSFKAFLAWHDVPFRRTHSLEELGSECVAIDSALAGVADQAAPLTEYAWKYRYPGNGEEATPAEAEQALAIARRVHVAVLTCLPAGAGT